MRHSLVYRIIQKIIKGLATHYENSATKRIINSIIAKIRLYFTNSLTFKVLIKNDKLLESKKDSSIINAFQSIISWIVKILNSTITKGFKGSFIISLFNSVEKEVKDSKGLFIVYLIVSIVIAYDVYSLITGSFSMNRAILTSIVIALFVLNNKTNILTAFQESIIKKSIVKIFGFNIEE